MSKQFTKSYKNREPSPEPPVEDDAFDVKAIEAHRNDRGQCKFHVRWDGRDSATGEDWSLDKHMTWEPPSSFDEGSTVLADYLVKHPSLANLPTLTFIRPLFQELHSKRIAEKLASGNAKKAGPGRASHPVKSTSVEPKKRKESTSSIPPKKKARTDPGPKKKTVAPPESDSDAPLSKVKRPKSKPSSTNNVQKKAVSKTKPSTSNGEILQPKLSASAREDVFEPQTKHPPTPPMQSEEDDDDQIYEPPTSPAKTGASIDYELDDTFFHGEDDSGMHIQPDVEVQPQDPAHEEHDRRRSRQLFGERSTSESEDDALPETTAQLVKSVSKKKTDKGKQKQQDIQAILDTSEEDDAAHAKEQSEKKKKSKEKAQSSRNPRTCTACRRAGCKGRGGVQHCDHQSTKEGAIEAEAASTSQKPASQKRYKPKATSSNSPKKDIFDKSTKQTSADREFSPDVPMSELAQAPKSIKKKKQSRAEKAIFGEEDEEARSVSPAKAEPKPVLAPENESESEKSAEEFDALFDERKTTVKNGVEQLGVKRISAWATKNTTSNGHLSEALMNTRFFKYHHGAKPAVGQILDFWSIPALYNGQIGLFDAMVKDKRIWIHAPSWVNNRCQDRNIQLDVYALQHLLMEKGAEEAGPDARDAAVIFIHYTELETYKGVEAIVKSKRMNKLRKSNEPSFFVWGTQITGMGMRKQELPIFQPIWTLGSALTFTSQVVVSSPQEFLSVIEACGNLTPLYLPWLHVGLVTTQGPLAPPVVDAPSTDVEASIAVSSATYGTALRVLQPSVPALAPCIGTKTMLNFPAALDIVDPSSFKDHAHQAIIASEDPEDNPEVAALMKTSLEMMIRYFGVRRWYVVCTALEHFDYEPKPNNPVEILDFSAAQEMISTFLL